MEEIRKYKKGQIISKEGVYELWMYDLMFGSVGIYANYGTADQVELSINNAPSFFGEVGFIESMPRYGTSVALEDCAVRIINHDNLSEYFEKRPAKVVSIMESLAKRLRNIYKLFASACNTFEEFVEAEESGEPISEELKARMIKFAAGAKRIRARNELRK